MNRDGKGRGGDKIMRRDDRREKGKENGDKRKGRGDLGRENMIESEKLMRWEGMEETDKKG